MLCHPDQKLRQLARIENLKCDTLVVLVESATSQSSDLDSVAVPSHYA
jgi:hypothetical protein